jgi:hypothetical protein
LNIKVAKDLKYGDIIVQAHQRFRVYTPFIPYFQSETLTNQPIGFSTFGYPGYLSLNLIASPDNSFELDEEEEEFLENLSEKYKKDFLDANGLYETLEIDGYKLFPEETIDTYDHYPFVVLEKNEYKL